VNEPEKSQTIKVHIQAVGPLTRSTVGSEPVPPEEEALDDVLHWIWSWRLQIRRISDSFDVQGSGSTNVERRQSWSRFSFDEHVLTVTGWNLARAIKRAEALYPEIRLSEQKSEALKLLRHLYEHWDEQRTAFRSSTGPKDRSAAAFADRFPEGRPWTMVFDRNDWILGGVVRLNELTRELSVLEPIILAIEERRRSKK
jgi:hypothetical protein